MNRIVYISFVFLVPFWILSPSYVLAQESTAVVKAEASATTAVSTSTKTTKGKARKTNQKLAQGLTLAETISENESPWAVSLSTFVSRGLDEFQDTLMSSNSLDFSYRLNQESSLGLSLGYGTIIYKKDGELFNNKEDQYDRYGIEDVSVSYTRPKIWSDKYNSLMWSNYITFPSSQSSQDSSLVVAAGTSFSLRYKALSNVIITPSVGMYGRHFRFDDADMGGYSVNSPFGYNYGISGSYIMTTWLTGSVGYSQTQRFDYKSDWKTIQGVSASLSASATDTLNVQLGYGWRDTYITNEPAFDDDTSSIYTGVSYAF